ncbi:hypothetical protein BOTCAL_0526g00010 [Botryotinia calthae]|uniref:Orp1 like protein n=1 Tax=Botryotinia calthae TaxID=38488 RepID=A0A4Y8CLC7_9HELO|nr:hypothetical protein BOTCAL_0526g00010 [Botryotinia calthae]
MDVTSLLNSNSAAAEQQKRQGERFVLPSRNRTPWDANGYSLPTNTSNHTINIGELGTGDELSTVNNDNPRIHCYDSHGTDSERSHHKFSDSRSSLSSFTSTTNSTATSSSNHSRLSSFSTNNSHPVSFSHKYCNSAAEHSTDLNSSYSITSQNNIESYSAPTSPHNTRKISIMVSSPTENLDALAALAEQESSRSSPKNQDARSQSVVAAPGAPDQVDSVRESESRPGSPSDTMLIRRPDLPRLNTDTSDNGFESDHSSNFYRSAPIEPNNGAMNPTLHKRNISAPILRRPSRVPSSSVGPIPELTPPNSTRLANLPSPLDDNEDAEGDPITPPPADGTDADTPPECMYITNCDTGSQPRKAISHIFGRNKMCTRLIPQSVWVHYCRKHYQRSRYRNPKEYAKLQCDLVQQQIRRVYDWSAQNQRRGEPGTIKDWGIAIRKRKQKRLDELKGSGRKRRFDDEDEGDNDQGPRPPTAVPDWLLSVIGSGYTTEEILEIFNRLHQEVLDDLLPCFPDIEILPNITVDQDEPKSPKGYAKRKVSSAGHKRSQSLGVSAMKAQNYSTPLVQDRRMSQPVQFQSPNAGGAPTYSTNLKRRRPNSNDANAQGLQFTPVPSNFERRRSFQPAFANTGFDRIDENHQSPAVDNGFEFPRGRTHARASSVYQSPLVAPVARPLGIHQNQVETQIQHMETGYGMNGGNMGMNMGMQGMQGRARPPHQRSQSDMMVGRNAMQPNMMISNLMSSQNFNSNVEFSTPQYQQSSFAQMNDPRQQALRQSSYSIQQQQQQSRRQFGQQQFGQQSPAGSSVANSPIVGPVSQGSNFSTQQRSQSTGRCAQQNPQMRSSQMYEDNTTRRRQYE